MRRVYVGHFTLHTLAVADGFCGGSSLRMRKHVKWEEEEQQRTGTGPLYYSRLPLKGPRPAALQQRREITPRASHPVTPVSLLSLNQSIKH